MLLEIGMQTKPIELIRIVTFIVLGAILVFIAQPLLYQNRILNFVIKDQPLDAWISNDYTPGATLVFCVASITAIVWYFWSARAKIGKAEEVQGWRLAWWLLGLLPVISIGVAIGMFNTSPDGSATLPFLYVLDVLVLYWLPTATSSPAPVKYVPPVSYFLRRLFEPGS
jgi:hypothetical protein